MMTSIVGRYFWLCLHFAILLTTLRSYTANGNDCTVLDVRANWHNSSQIKLLKRASGGDYWLYFGDFKIQGNTITGGDRLPLPLLNESGYYAFLAADHLRNDLWWLIKEPMAVVLLDRGGLVRDATFVQLPGLLDELFFYPGNDLGVNFIGNIPRVKVWAPTAKSVKIHIYDGSDVPTQSASLSLELSAESQGVWAINGQPFWRNKFYLFEVQVFMPVTGRVEKNFVTDPYSRSLAVNSEKSQFVDVNDPALKPEGWDSLVKPEFENPEDIVIYELHVRDFSGKDTTMAEAFRGTYLAFTQETSQAVLHLQLLAQAGVTHIHFLPLFDFTSVNEDPRQIRNPHIPLDLPPQSPIPQETIARVRDFDRYNWGYDPYHYFVPEGSYATDADGARRIWEVRRMVKALNKIGLRVIQDTVFNHTFACGLANNSVFDKVVPGYYYRMDEAGRVYNSTCCADTASEHKMMEKLMIDAVKFWAKTYKFDGFRFDLMNMHTRENMLHVKEAMQTLTLERDGVDGTKLFIYGEGWDFGSIHATRPGQSFNQMNSYGAGIGMFNDRMRDALRGGTTDTKEKSDQGFVTGLFYDFNQEPANHNTPVDSWGQQQKLLHLGDVIRFGLAGNLRDYVLRDFQGNTVRGGDLFFRGGRTAYAADPADTINYVSAHDGYSLWDAINAKLPFYTPGRTPRTATKEERMRVQNLALAFIALAQGVPFFEGGSDILRSKSGDVDSYDSGDWFNLLTFSLKHNNWGIGLPPAWKNHGDWSFWAPRLRESELQPSSKEIVFAFEYFQQLLQIRRSSRLLRLTSADEIFRRVSFLNTGTNQIPGLIVMNLRDDFDNSAPIDRKRRRLVVCFNVTRSDITFIHDSFKGQVLEVHELLNSQIDPALSRARFDALKGAITVPARATVVFYTPRSIKREERR